MIVHIQTIVQTTFGVVDDDGNAIQQQPVVVTIGLLKLEAFAQAYEEIVKARENATVDPLQAN